MSGFLFSTTRKFTAVTLAVSLIMVMSTFTGTVYANEEYLTPPELSSFQKGMCFATWEKDRFASPYAKKSLEKLRDMGVQYIQIVVTQYQDTYNSTEIKSNEMTPSDKSLKAAIRAAHELGLKVMLKPHIDLIDKGDGSYWRADIGFNEEEDWLKWFREYTGVVTHYAKLAEKENVELLCVGTELVFTTQKTEYWRKVIKEIRDVYSGKLIYAANWDNFKNVQFWDDLDYVGIDAYFPLTYSNCPGMQELVSGWEKWKVDIEVWHMTVNKPVVFTEIGYASTSHAPCEPWKNGSGNPDIEMQTKCYNAFFEAVWDSPWLAGVYWWKWSPTIYGGGENNRYYTPLNKPASAILEKHYKSARGRQADIEEKVLASGKMAGALVPAAQKDVSAMGATAVMNTGTLMPELKTQNDRSFRKKWKEETEKSSAKDTSGRQNVFRQWLGKLSK